MCFSPSTPRPPSLSRTPLLAYPAHFHICPPPTYLYLCIVQLRAAGSHVSDEHALLQPAVCSHTQHCRGDDLTRIAIVNDDKCKPSKCRQECKRTCPVVRMGKLCIEVEPKSKVPAVRVCLREATSAPVSRVGF